MRIAFTIILFFLMANANAQVTLSAKAGWNTNVIKVSKGSGGSGISDWGGQQGWQAGLQLTLPLGHWFLYTGPEVDANNFYIHRYYPSNDYNTIYHPVYLSMPLGAGYSFSIHKGIAVSLFGGVYGAVGIGGKVKEIDHESGLFVGTPANWPPVATEHTIEFNHGNLGTLKPTNTGIQAGAGIKGWRRWGLAFTYNAGFSNIQPVDNSYQLKLQSFMVNLEYDIVSFGRK